MEFLERQIRELIESRDDFVIVLDSTGHIVTINDHWRVFCEEGRLSEALWQPGSDYTGFLKETKKLTELQSIEDVMSGHLPEYRQLSPYEIKGETKWLLIKIRQFFLEDGSIGAILYQHPVDFQPIESINMTNILDSVTDTFFLLDEGMKFQYMNAAAELFFMRTRQEMEGLNIWELFPGAAQGEFYQHYTKAMEERIPIKFDAPYGDSGIWYEVKLYPAINGGLAVYCRDIGESKTAEQELEDLHSTDYLTGLRNRAKAEEKITFLLKEKAHFSIFFIDLDQLKHINTLYSHAIGDQLLQSVAKRIQELIREGDLASRLESDEMIVIRPYDKGEEIHSFASKLNELFEPPFEVENQQLLHINASIGIATCPWDSADMKELLAFAEKAMREAKKRSGTSYSVFRPAMSLDVARREVIERDLSGDLQKLGFEFLMQPQINAATGELKGAEVLSRWNHPELGIISPVEFISVAEETGVIGRMTWHLLNDVFAYMKVREDRYGSSLRTSINITPKLLADHDFFTELFKLMNRYEIPAELLEIEVKENVELAYSEKILQNLLACRSKGVSIALDDFGTGFSKLSYLIRLPIDKIKLDRYFVHKIGQDPKAEGILGSLVQFVNSIGCDLVAEGVERTEEADFLKEQGCLVHQGYLYGQPLDPMAFNKKYLTANS